MLALCFLAGWVAVIGVIVAFFMGAHPDREQYDDDLWPEDTVRPAPPREN